MKMDVWGKPGEGVSLIKIHLIRKKVIESVYKVSSEVLKLNHDLIVGDKRY